MHLLHGYRRALIRRRGLRWLLLFLKCSMFFYPVFPARFLQIWSHTHLLAGIVLRWHGKLYWEEPAAFRRLAALAWDRRGFFLQTGWPIASLHLAFFFFVETFCPPYSAHALEPVYPCYTSQ